MDSKDKSEAGSGQELNPTADAIIVAEGLAMLAEAITKAAQATDRFAGAIEKLAEQDLDDDDPAGLGGFDMGGNKIG